MQCRERVVLVAGTTECLELAESIIGCAGLITSTVPTAVSVGLMLIAMQTLQRLCFLLDCAFVVVLRFVFVFLVVVDRVCLFHTVFRVVHNN